MNIDPRQLAKLTELRQELTPQENERLDGAALNQVKLTPPKNSSGDDSATRRARYSAARSAMIAELKTLSFVTTPVTNSADWAFNPNVIALRLNRDTWSAPAFQFGEDADPLALVTTVNSRLALSYRHHQRPPWGDEKLDRLIWWFVDHKDLGYPPIGLLGTNREAELERLATPETLRG